MHRYSLYYATYTNLSIYDVCKLYRVCVSDCTCGPGVHWLKGIKNKTEYNTIGKKKRKSQTLNLDYGYAYVLM